MKSRIILSVVVCLAFLSCDQLTTPDDGGGGTPAATKPTISSFTASPDTIKRGSSTTLGWSTSGANSCELNWGIGDVSSSGSKVVNPTDDKTYRLTAWNDEGYVYKECKVSVTNGADVYMSVGPNFTQDQYTITYSGRVRNRGQWTAEFVKIYLYLYDKTGKLFQQDYAYADKYEIDPQDYSPWDLDWWDSDKAIRNRLDKTRTEYEITWSEYDFAYTTGRMLLFDQLPPLR